MRILIYESLGSVGFLFFLPYIRSRQFNTLPSTQLPHHQHMQWHTYLRLMSCNVPISNVPVPMSDNDPFLEPLLLHTKSCHVWLPENHQKLSRMASQGILLDNFYDDSNPLDGECFNKFRGRCIIIIIINQYVELVSQPVTIYRKMRRTTVNNANQTERE